MRMNVRHREEWLNQMGEKFFADPTERQTRHRHAKLRRRKISVEMRTNIFRQTRARVTLLHQSVELTRANFNDREFARDEKSVQADQRRDRQKFRDDDTGRVPLRHWNVGKRQDLK